MARKKPIRAHKHNYTLEDILNVLDEVMDIYMTKGSDMSWANILLYKHKMTPQLLNNWKHKHEEVLSKVESLNSIRDLKVMGKFLNGEGDTGLIWFSKTNMNWIAEETRVKIESDKDIAQINKDTVINVGWEHGTYKPES